MSWNYRILRKPLENNPRSDYYYSIVEFYYDRNGKVDGWCERKDILEWDCLESLNGTIKLLQKVIGKSILEEKDNTLIEIKEQETNGKIDQSNN